MVRPNFMILYFTNFRKFEVIIFWWIDFALTNKIETTTDICKFLLNLIGSAISQKHHQFIHFNKFHTIEHLRRSNRLTPTMTHPPLQSRIQTQIHTHSTVEYLFVSVYVLFARSHYSIYVCVRDIPCLLVFSFHRWCCSTVQSL